MRGLFASTHLPSSTRQPAAPTGPAAPILPDSLSAAARRIGRRGRRVPGQLTTCSPLLRTSFWSSFSARSNLSRFSGGQETQRGAARARTKGQAGGIVASPGLRSRFRRTGLHRRRFQDDSLLSDAHPAAPVPVSGPNLAALDRSKPSGTELDPVAGSGRPVARSRPRHMRMSSCISEASSSSWG